MIKKNFTLIELILVVAIIAVLAGAMIPIVKGAQEDAKVSRFLLTFEALKKSSTLYYDDTGELPSTSADLVSDSGAPNWNGPYVDKALTTQDNPYNGAIRLGSSRNVDLVERIIIQTISLSADGVPSSFAKKIDEAIEPDGPNPWDGKGWVRYRSASSNISIAYQIDVENY